MRALQSEASSFGNWNYGVKIRSSVLSSSFPAKVRQVLIRVILSEAKDPLHGSLPEMGNE